MVEKRSLRSLSRHAITAAAAIREIRLDPGQRVAGTGEEIDRVLRLDDGRTAMVRLCGVRA